MKKQPEITDQTRQALVDAFCELYAYKSIEKISIREITSVAGYHRSTFYEYFQDIYDLLKYLEDDLLNSIKINLSNTNITKREQADMKKLLWLFGTKEKYLSVLLGMYGSFHFIERMKQELCISEERLPTATSSKFTPYLNEYHLTVSISLFQLWLKRNKDISLDELSALIHTLYTNGITAIILE